MLSRIAVAGRHFFRKNRLNRGLLPNSDALVVGLGCFVKLTRFVHLAQPLVFPPGPPSAL